MLTDIPFWLMAVGWLVKPIQVTRLIICTTPSIMNILHSFKAASFGLLLAASSISVNATVNNTDDATLINSDWQYLQYAADTPQQAIAKNDWQNISLPHTWNATDTVDSTPGYRRSTSWYKRELNQKVDSNQRYFVYFEGANMETKLYVNNQLAGEHVGGYLGFEIEITDQLNANGPNQLLVSVSNRYNPNLIPSQKADFFIHGGITRDVWLKSLPTTHISRVFIDTPEVSATSASTSVTVVGNAKQVKNMGEHPHRVEVRVSDKNGNEVNKATKDLTINTASFQATVELNALESPQLWSPDSPNLYSVQATLLDANETVVHSVSERFGYRWFEMRPNQGFFVNGQRMLIRGTHRHEEHAGVGAAMSNEQHRNDMQMIKDLGANFVRLGHYPQDPEVYRAADELGLVIWDELPWCRGGKGGTEWEQNTENYLKNMITQNRNYASIAFWSLGNEMYWEEDFPGGGDSEILNPYLSKLNSMTKSMDASRMTTVRKYYPGAEIVDAFSPSIWAGWYGGAYNQYQAAVDDAMQKYPTFLHMEYGGSSHVGRHTEQPIPETGIEGAQVSVAEAVSQAKVTSVAKGSDWNENYMVDLFDWHLRVSENTPNFAGNAQWAFKDFGTPLRPENPIPYVNQKGLVDRSGKPKDAYYVFASYWKTEPFCYCLLYTSPSPRDRQKSRMPSSA